MRGRTVRAAGSLYRAPRLLTVTAFTHHTPARHGDPEGTYRRPLTSRAHRLRKPDRVSELLVPSVARWASGAGSMPALRSAPRSTHRARSTVAAAGLGRRRPLDQSTFRRFDSSFAARAGEVALVVHVRCLTPHPVARRELGPAPSRAGGSPRAIPQSPETALRRPRDPRERCVSPTSATDSRNEHPSDHSIPGRTP